jgi:indolepyruvate ferredoxin oxidoreductase beta subunit
VISGATQYPGQTEIRQRLAELTERNWSLNATEKAMDLGNAIFANIIMLGALSELCLLPFSREDFTEVLTSTLPSDKVSINLDAFDSAAELMHASN